VHRDPREVVAVQQELADMEPGPNPEIELISRVDDRLRAPDTSDGTIETGEYTVTGGLHHDPAVTIDLGRGHTIMRVEQFAPAPIAELCSASRGVDDVGEQHRREYVIDVDPWWRSQPGDELLDDVERLGLLVIDEAEMPVTGQLDQTGTGNQLGERKGPFLSNDGIAAVGRLALELPAARSSGWLSNEASAGRGPVTAWLERGEQHLHQECPS
jgi:hypothetical protein